ncbi:NAD(P)/FAD-dependent oxidoreductase [Skermania sp. ID1734]|uniref:NAD(P)/FAD-dependent oxidoreductase n=1 Tax=Skermania sp. ID1734 TaxID=2597516 RepID=UPI00117CD9D8|nr:FAD-dependent oxidoreductase [Skermania sp. ID1734]TSD99995.1 NAD(P)/FAD-dependent oxidoreductase [Skermania sp. ID1734]
MSDEQTIVIVGAGLAGAKTAEALRDNDFPGRVVLIGAEEHLPYDRPPLSKEYLQGKKSFDEIVLQPRQWFRDHHVDLQLGTTVTGVDRDAKTVSLPDGSTLSYDKLVLATGSSSARPPIPGADAAGVYYLRNVEESDALKSLFGPGKRLAIIGAGWIGLEVAAAAREAGTEVTVVEAAEHPLQAALGPEMGAVFAELHRQHGVEFHFTAKVSEITTDDGRASGVRLGDGSTISADAVLVAVGARPNIALASDAGLDTNKGVQVDASLRTSDPDIVAVGDIAEEQHPTLGTVRVEHWANALNQPAVAAATLVGKDTAYDRLPYFFTDQYDLGMEYTGYATDYAQVVVRGDTDKREFLAFWLDDDRRVKAAMNVNIWDVTDKFKELINSGRSVDPARLADPSVPLEDA